MSRTLPIMTREVGRAVLLPMVLDSLDAENTRRAYRRALESFFDWYKGREHAPFDRMLIQAYITRMKRAGSSASTINQALAAIRALARESAINGFLDSATCAAIEKIKNAKHSGRRTGQWLTIEKATELLHDMDTTTLRGKRDRVSIGLMIEAGLRREEAAEVTIEQIQERDGRMVLVDLVGKGNKRRTVPIPHRLAVKITDYIEYAGITSGPLLRQVNKADRLEDREGGITPTAIYMRLREYADSIGVKFSPHDLRRTFGKLALDAGAEMIQIRDTYGHESVRTTERYLGAGQKLTSGDAPCDKIKLKGEE